MLAIDTGTNNLTPVINLLYDIKNNMNNGHSTFKARGTITEDNFMNINDFKTHTNKKMDLYIMNKNADYTVDAFNTITFDSISGSFGLTTSCYSTQSILDTSFGSYITTYQTIYSSMEDRVIDNTDNVGIYPWTNKNYDGYIVKYNTYTNLPDLREYSFKSLTQYYNQVASTNSVNIDWRNKLNKLEEFKFVDATSTITSYTGGLVFKFDSNQSIKNIFITNQNNPAIRFSDVKASNLTYNNLMESGVNLLNFENCDVRNFYAEGYFNGFTSIDVAAIASSGAFTSPKIENATLSVSQTLNELPYDYLNIQNLTVNNISNKFQDCKFGNVDFLNSGSHYFISLNMFNNACLSNFGTVHFNYYNAPDASLTVKNGDVAIFDPYSCRLNELSVENLNSVDFSLSWWWNPTKLICDSVKNLTFNNLLDKPPMTIKNCSNVKFIHPYTYQTATFLNCSFDNIDTLSFTDFVFSSCSVNDIHNFDLSNGTFSYCNMNNISGNGVGSVVVNHPNVASELNMHSFKKLTLSNVNYYKRKLNFYDITNVKIRDVQCDGFYGNNINNLIISSSATLSSVSFENVDTVCLFSSNAIISGGENLVIKNLIGDGGKIENVENVSIDSFYSANNMTFDGMKNLTINYAPSRGINLITNVEKVYFKIMPDFDLGIGASSWHVDNVRSTRLSWFDGSYFSASSMTIFTNTAAWVKKLKTFICEDMFVVSNSGNYTFSNVNDITISNMFFGGSNHITFNNFNNLDIEHIASNSNESLIVSGANHNNITINNFDYLKFMNLINNNQIKLNSGSVYELTISNSQNMGSLSLSNVSIESAEFNNLSFADFGNGVCDEVRIQNVLNCGNPFYFCQDVFIDAAHSASLSNYVEHWGVSHVI